jgi:hypothetical protein
LPEATERNKEKALLHEDYRKICKQLSSRANIKKEYRIHNEMLCWKNRVYVPKGLSTRAMESEHISKIAGLFR